jgi:L-lactate dehydrogenase complex protein LldE
MPERGADVPRDVALFVPCYVDQLAPEIGLASAALLERLGCRVTFDERQTCCGQPFVTTGARAEAERLARGHARIFANAAAVVCPSASCVATVRRRYAGLVGAEPAASLAARTFELGEFVALELGASDVGARFPHRVALLESCHGLRELWLGNPSERLGPASPPGVTERLLRAVAGLELVPHSRRDECCGFGGAFSVRQPEVSAAMVADKVASVEDTGAAEVLSGDCGCLMNIGGAAEKKGSAVRARHIASFLMERCYGR